MGRRFLFPTAMFISPELLHSEYGIPLEEIEAFRDIVRVYSS
jgi:hypothetical protein